MLTLAKRFTELHLICRRSKEKSYLVWQGPKSTCNSPLYGACLVGGEDNVSQARLAKAGGISVVTLRKRLGYLKGIS